MPTDAHRWRTDEPAFRQRIDLTSSSPTGVLSPPYRSLLDQLSAYLGHAPTFVDYAESRRDVPRTEQWQTLTIVISEHEIVVVTTAEPSEPGIPVHALVVDDVLTRPPMTGARPLADELFDVVARQLPARRTAATA